MILGVRVWGLVSGDREIYVTFRRFGVRIWLSEQTLKYYRFKVPLTHCKCMFHNII